MSEVIVETPAETPVEEVVEVSPIEEEARSQGWVSKEEWVAAGKDEAEHRSAKEFVERGELYKSIHNTRRELQQTKAALDSLARHHQHVYQKAYFDAMEELKLDKRAALREGDGEAVAIIEDKMEDLTKRHQVEMGQFQREQVAARQQGTPPELVDWMTRNTWYTNDPQLREEADAAGFIYLNNGGTREGLLEHVEKKVKQKFPEKFGAKRAAPNAVAGVDRTGRKARPESYELNELETKIMNDLVRTGVMSKEQYIKELKGKG